MIDTSQPQPLRSEREYNRAIGMMDRLLDGDPREDAANRMKLAEMTALVEAYEAQHYPDEMFSTTPQDVVDFALGQKGMQRGDLAEIMGGKSRVSEFFAGKRELSRTQIRALRDLLGVPADLLL
jgi:HTH-type transcriptional regulator/antitoxin HigA